MKLEEIERIKELRKEINELPKGYISKKEIGGNIYYYHQWSEDGKKYSKYIPDDQIADLNALITKRQELEIEFKNLKHGTITSSLYACCLMHKNIEVVDLYIDSNNGLIKTIGLPHELSHLPIGTFDSKNKLNESKLSDWWNNRSIPMSRSGIKEAMETLNISSPQALLVHCRGLSLSDQYWIKQKNSNLKWEDVNYFDNDFSEDVGKILLGSNEKSKNLNLSSPDSTSVGNLKKRWKISNGKRILIKGGSNPFRQEPFNEVVAYFVAKALGIKCVKYSVYSDKDYPYCECEDFINKDEDLVTAYQIMRVDKKTNDESSYSYFVRCSNSLGIKNVKEIIDRMLVLDFIIANEDRHLNNFGFIRNVNDLTFNKEAIIYDNGGSFGFDKITDDILAFNNISTKPFKEDIKEQLKLVSDFSWIDIKQLERVKEIIKSKFEEYESKYLDKKRIAAIADSSNKRIDYLINTIQKRSD